MRNSVVDSLYISHCSGPMAAFSAVYRGSRSIRAGMSWLVFMGFTAPGAETLRLFVERIGVERLADGLLKAAGSISGMLDRGNQQGCRVQRNGGARRARWNMG